MEGRICFSEIDCKRELRIAKLTPTVHTAVRCNFLHSSIEWMIQKLFTSFLITLEVNIMAE